MYCIICTPIHCCSGKCIVCVREWAYGERRTCWSAPLPVKVAVVHEHTSELLGVMVMFGDAFTEMLCTAKFVQPLTAVPTTVNVVFTIGLAT